MRKLIKFIMGRFFKPSNEVLTLRAIESVRLELAHAARSGANRIEIDAILERLTSLYASLNVHNVIVAIERIDFKDAA